MTRSSQIVAGLALALLAPLTASAQVDRLAALEGPTLMSAVTGDGGLPVGVAPSRSSSRAACMSSTPCRAPLVRG